METRKQSHRLRELIEERGMRRITLAAACNVDTTTITRWQHGYSVIPSDKLPMLADVLGVSVSELMGWPDEIAA